jgi:hypothetical protein
VPIENSCSSSRAKFSFGASLSLLALFRKSPITGDSVTFFSTWR